MREKNVKRAREQQNTLEMHVYAVLALERFHLPSFNYLIIFFSSVQHIILNVLYSPVAKLLLN